MTRVIHLDLPPIPKQGGKGLGGYHRVRKRDGISYYEWLEAARCLLQVEVRRAGWTYVPQYGLVELSADIYFARKKRPSWCPKELWDQGIAFRRPVTPDSENVVGSVMDALSMTKKSVGRPNVWHDDAQCDLGHVRRWVCAKGGEPGFIITLKALDLLGNPVEGPKPWGNP